MRSSLWVICSLLVTSLPAFSQQRGTITGEILDQTTRRPLVGAQVSIPGTALGTVTNATGRYLLPNAPIGEVTIRVQFIGYSTASRTVAVGAGETVTANFELSQAAIALDEVVVTGVGVATERRKLGNTIATIDTRKLEAAPAVSFSELLQAREPGVMAMSSGGLAGEGMKIRIRGSSSLSQSNEPIVYVDGVRVDNSAGFGPGVGLNGGGPSRLDDINPASIERIEVLKGAAAATLYGTEASNGVIQIFTKQGMSGAPRYDFVVETGVSSYPKDSYAPHAGFARTQERADQLSKFWGRTIRPYEVFEVDLIPQLFEAGRFSTISGSVSGGTDAVMYFISGRYQTEDGPFGGTQDQGPLKGERWGPASDVNNRKQANTTLTVLPFENLKVRVTSSLVEAHQENVVNNNSIYGTISQMINSKPELAHDNNVTGTGAFSTVREAMQQITSQDVARFGGTVAADYTPVAGVGLNATIGIDVVSQRGLSLTPYGWNVDNYVNANVKGSRRVSDRKHRQVTLQTRATWNENFSPDLTSALALGGQVFLTETKSAYGTGSEFPGPGIDVTGGGALQTTFESYLSQVNAGLFLEEQIGFQNVAFLTVGGRYDKHSAFGQQAGGALYPKASVSLVLSDLPEWNQSLFSTLRLRAAIGRSGLQPGAFDKFTTFAPLASELGPGVAPDNLGNPDLKPEVSTEWEVGTELGWFQNRLALQATYWDRTVVDALVPRQYPVSGGFRATQLDNIGKLHARGLEFGINGLVINRPNFSVDFMINASNIKETVVDLGGAPPIKVSGTYARYINWIREGYAPGSFFGPKLMQIEYPLSVSGDCTPATREQLLNYFAVPRNPDNLSVLVEGCGGDYLNNYLGKPTPDWSGAFGTDVTLYRNLKISTLFEYKFGNYFVHDLTGALRRAHALIGRNERKSAEVEAILLNPASTAEERFEAGVIWARELKGLTPFDGLNEVHRADFLRWRELGLTYTVAPSLAEKFHARSLAVTLAGRNLGIITRYPGADPEMNALSRGAGGSSLAESFQEGINAWGLPIPRRYQVSVRMGF
jgi:TonB-linked SusC/RagA family outer membrane protein